jgi:hypothetical protein
MPEKIRVRVTSMRIGGRPVRQRTRPAPTLLEGSYLKRFALRAHADGMSAIRNVQGD